jgi:hypothetical protein
MPDRIVLLCALFVLLAPLGAAAQFGAKQEVYEIPPGLVSKHNGECKRITRQIAHYAEVADRAKERGDDEWYEGTVHQIGRLATRRAELCPTIYAQKPIGEELSKMLKGAAKIAFKLFTMGMI